jgi:hypothetical protein
MQLNITDKHKEVLYEQSLTQYRNIARVKVANGHQIFKMSIETLLVNLADYTVEVVKEDNKEYKKIKIEFVFGYIYIPALNLKNAVRKANMILYTIDNMIKKNMEIIDDPAKPMHSSLRGAEQINNNNP